MVSGRVQGVFFRMFVLREAKALGLTGTVRNLRDGSVEVEAEGDRSALEQLVQRLRQGPSGSLVQNVALDWEDYQNNYGDFQIDYA